MYISNAFPQGSAGQAGEFLRYGVGAKALGMGRAFTSIADDGSALYWNPAGLTNLDKNGATVMFMHLPLQEGASFNYLSGAIPLRLFFIKNTKPNWFIKATRDLKLGLGIIWHSLGEFNLYDSDANRIEGGGNNISESALLLSASYPLNKLVKKAFRGNQPAWLNFFRGHLEAGYTTKLVSQDIFGETGKATSMDLGFKYTHYSNFFNVGLMFRDFNSANFKYKNRLPGDELSSTSVVGFSINPPIPFLRGLMLSFDYGFKNPGERDNQVMFGVEYDFSRLNARWPVKMRVGANSGRETLTIGISFSAEQLWGNDWLPSGDWTFANDKSEFDAVGPMFSFSMDRNPFTAKYWYLNALFELSEFGCMSSDNPDKNDVALRYLNFALNSKNPGNRAYRYEAALRLVDLQFLQRIAELQKKRQKATSSLDISKKFGKVKSSYEGYVHKYKLIDTGKGDFDKNTYSRSFLLYLQSLILAGHNNLAIESRENNGSLWANRVDIAEYLKANDAEKYDNLNYLYAYALFSENRSREAVDVIDSKLNQNSLSLFLQAHILFLEGAYTRTYAILSSIDLNNTQMPENIYLPLTNDCNFGDEILFLKAACLFYLNSDFESHDFINEFAKISRFFPRSDLAKFFTDNQTITDDLLTYFEGNDRQNLTLLVRKLIQAYIKTFSNGTLTHEVYTYHFN